MSFQDALIAAVIALAGAIVWLAKMLFDVLPKYAEVVAGVTTALTQIKEAIARMTDR